MTGWLIAFGILLLLVLLPLGVVVKYNAEGPQVRVIAGPLRFTVFPAKKKEKKPKKEKPTKDKKAKKQKAASSATAEKKQEKGGSILDFMPLARLVLEFLTDFRHKLRLNRLDLKVIMAGGDPADLAVNYGRAWVGIGNLFPLLERAFVIKKRNVEVQCDFTAEQTTVIARLDITITLGRLFSLGVRYGIRGLRILTKIMKTRKGGASK